MRHVQYEYEKSFLEHAARSGRYSSTKIIRLLQSYFAVGSVLDVGCATGTWLRAWQALGVGDIHGVDGLYISPETLEIPRAKYTAVDLNRAFDLGRTFDLVQSLEVAEHLEPEQSENFVYCLAAHAERFVLFSAAPPGQGGEFHINERSYEYWRDLFERRGFVTADPIRPLIMGERTISYWYRYNVLLFVRRECLAGLPDLAKTVIDAHEAIRDVSPPSFRWRKAVLRVLPGWLQHKLARLKANHFPTRRF